MSELIRQQRHFLLLFVQTIPAQRKALLQTITKNQLRALSQIAHNFIKHNIKILSKDKERVRRERRFIHLLGDKRLGFVHKKKLIQSKQRILQFLVGIAVDYLKPILQ